MIYAKNQVVIELKDGIAQVVRCPSDIDVIVIDYDNSQFVTLIAQGERTTINAKSK
jgi:hypothetical protein